MFNKRKIIKSVVIVGGGAAGWLTANHLAKKFSLPGELDISVTLVESPSIPTIGVGEGTVPMMRETLRYFGIDEAKFIQECDVTFKQSIKFVDWVHNPEVGSHYYHHLFDYPQGINNTKFWVKQDPQNRHSFADTFSYQSRIIDKGLGPKAMTHPQFEGACQYAYHLDAVKFSNLLCQHAVHVLGVKHILADVMSVKTKDDQSIDYVETEQAGRIEADLYIDCTGFSAKLIGEACEVPFIDKSDVLFVDSAIAVQLPYESADSPIPCCTISTAKEAGWIWDIGLTERRGTGYVYSSRHSTKARAEQVLRDYLGDNNSELTLRHIPMKVGHRQQAWHKNCVAIGLSSGFVEPLEATGLLIFDFSAKMLADCFPSNSELMPLIAERYNQRLSDIWLSVINFIKLHYVLSKRTDTAFWRDNRVAESIPESLLAMLEVWRLQVPSQYDFVSSLDIFKLENYLYVLYGMEFNTDLKDWNKPIFLEEPMKEQLQNLSLYSEQINTQLYPHRELLKRIHQYGIQKS